MHKTCKKSFLTVLLYMSTAGYAAPVSDENLDHNVPEIMIEEELRLLEKDLNGDPYKGESVVHWDSDEIKFVPWIPESDIVAIQALTRHHLNSLPRAEFYGKNMPKIREKENLAVAQRSGEMARYFVAKHTDNDQRKMANAERIEREEVMALLKNNPLRKGRTICHCFGKPLEKRMIKNIRDGKYGY